MFFEKEYAAGRVRAMRAKLLKSDLSEIAGAKSVSDMLLALSSTHYEHAFAKRNLVHNERALRAHYAHVLKRVLSFLPKDYYDSLVIFSLDSDARNLKTCARGFFSGLDWNAVRRDLLSCGIVFERTKGQNLDGFEMLCSLMDGTEWHEVLKKCILMLPRLDLAEHEIDRHVFIRADKAPSESVRRFFLEKKELHDFRVLCLAESAGISAPSELLYVPQDSGHIMKKYAHLKAGDIEQNIKKYILGVSHELMHMEPFSVGLFIDFFCRTESETEVLAATARRISSRVAAVGQAI